MPALDWIFVAVLLGSLALGAMRGLVFELFSLLSWLLAFMLAQWFALEVGHRLPITGASDTVRYAAGFVTVFVLMLFLGGLIARLATKLFAAIGLRPVDRVLGAGFGLARGALLVLAATVAVNLTPLKSDPWWQQSNGAKASMAALGELKPLLPQDFSKYLPS